MKKTTIVTTRRNAPDDAAPPTRAKGGETSHPHPHGLPEMVQEDYDENADYDGIDGDGDDEYYEEDYPQPIDAEEPPMGVVLCD